MPTDFSVFQELSSHFSEAFLLNKLLLRGVDYTNLPPQALFGSLKKKKVNAVAFCCQILFLNGSISVGRYRPSSA